MRDNLKVVFISANLDETARHAQKGKIEKSADHWVHNDSISLDSQEMMIEFRCALNI